MLNTLKKILAFKLIDTEKIDVTVLTVVFLIVVLFLTGIVLRFVRRFVTRKLPVEDKNKFISVFQFVKYLVYVLVFMFTLHSSGVNMNIFITASAALFVGLGFALQTFFQDIISGILMILDQSLHVSNNPPITVFRTRAVTIDLDLTSLSFNIVTDDKTTFFSTGLVHDSGTSGAGAQGKSDGRLSWTVPVSAPDTLYYANADGTIFGTINIENAPSAFSEIEISGTTASTSSTTGALTVAGGVGIAGDLYVAGSLNIDGIGITSISSSTNLELEAANQIVVKVDGNTVGVVKSTGSALPIVDTTINNTVIGNTTPSTAVFTSAAVTNLPTVANSVTNKEYVDGTAIAFSIAFGL